ncbi:hypothetical protein Pmani_023055 [Petrolisthes manimaculis]|uniref:Uncharacterized protein n=1 Tax=Petrolisthes manimaculis TaxID=1843537 RepID=A0AAE1U1H6_9EUCA|nr:hypothetical protein Pmani_023055 [Petrolisthes manimaculis]
MNPNPTITSTTPSHTVSWVRLRRSNLEPVIHTTIGDGRRSPTPLGGGEAVGREITGTVSHIHPGTQYSSANLSSPYLLHVRPPSSTQIHCPLTSPSHTAPNLCYPAQYSSEFNTMELDSLRQQVQEIKHQLAGDVTGRQEYQKLLAEYQIILAEKSHLQETLGSTEYSLQQLQVAYNGLQKDSAACEQSYSLKLSKAEERTAKEIEEKKIAWERVAKLQQYINELPTAEEHQNLQDDLEVQTEDNERLLAKVDHLAYQLKIEREHEKEQAASIETQRKEKDDLLVKLNLAENILNELESHRDATTEDGKQSMEELLWILEQTRKELDAAKKLVNYRKVMLEEQATNHDKIQREEFEQREKLEEKVRVLEWTVVQHKELEDKLRYKLKKTGENLREAEKRLTKTEERLEAALGEVTSQQEIAKLVASLMTVLQTAINQLRDLVDISQQISQGQTPDITVLLNFTNYTDAQEEVNSDLSRETLSAQLKEVKHMISRLDAVRLQLQDKHAEQLAKDVTCTQM